MKKNPKREEDGERHMKEAGKQLATKIRAVDKEENQRKQRDPLVQANLKIQKRLSRKVKQNAQSLLKSKANGFDILRNLTDLLLEEVAMNPKKVSNCAIEALDVLLKRIRKLFHQHSVRTTSATAALMVEHAYEICRLVQFGTPRSLVKRFARRKPLYPVLHGTKSTLWPACLRYVKEIETGKDVPISYDPISRRSSPDIENEVLRLFEELAAAGIDVGKINKGNSDDYWNIAVEGIIPFYYRDLDAAYRSHQIISKEEGRARNMGVEHNGRKAARYYLEAMRRIFQSMALNAEGFSGTESGPLTPEEGKRFAAKVKKYIGNLNLGGPSNSARAAAPPKRRNGTLPSQDQPKKKRNKQRLKYERRLSNPKGE